MNEIRFAVKKDITKNESIFMLYFELDKDVDTAYLNGISRVIFTISSQIFIKQCNPQS